MLLDHLQSVPLQNGLTARLSVLAAVSLDLAGRVEVSLWNRAAQAQLDNRCELTSTPGWPTNTDHHWDDCVLDVCDPLHGHRTQLKVHFNRNAFRGRASLQFSPIGLYWWSMRAVLGLRTQNLAVCFSYYKPIDGISQVGTTN